MCFAKKAPSNLEDILPLEFVTKTLLWEVKNCSNNLINVSKPEIYAAYVTSHCAAWLISAKTKHDSV